MKQSFNGGTCPCYRFTLSEKIGGLLISLRQKAAPRPYLLAGPFTGEFGYELMFWQGFIRARVPHYREVHVMTYSGREYLYPGCHVHIHSVRLESAGYGYGLMSPETAAAVASAKTAELQLKNYDLFTTQLISTRYHRSILWQQKLTMLREPPLNGPRRDIAIHFRAIDKEGPDKSKNYPRELADALAARAQEAGLRVCCIGHPEYAYCPEGCEDLRSIDVKQSVAAICSVKAVVGENSGPMHLANLCGVPTIIWAAAQWRIDYSFRWNVFHVPIFVAANDTHTPSVDRVLRCIEEAFLFLKKWRSPYRDAGVGQVVAAKVPSW